MTSLGLGSPWPSEGSRRGTGVLRTATCTPPPEPPTPAALAQPPQPLATLGPPPQLWPPWASTSPGPCPDDLAWPRFALAERGFPARNGGATHSHLNPTA
eukprot:EG_transcript_22472